MSVGWDEFVATHGAAVLTAALRVVANSADADEVAQEVFVEIFKSGKFAELHSQGGLLRTMATRRALDRLRRHKPSVALNGSEVDRGELEPHEYVIAGELDQRLRDALQDLPSREAEVFCLVYFEDYAPAEISELLGISTGAVNKSLCKARQKLSVAFECSTIRGQT